MSPQLCSVAIRQSLATAGFKDRRANAPSWLPLLALCCAAAALLCSAPALALSTWSATNGVSADTNWSTSTNWIPAGVPGPSSSVGFYTPTALPGPASPFLGVGQGFGGIINSNNFNSFVDTNFSGSIGSLSFGNTNASFQNVLLGSNLIVGGSNFTVGNELSGIDSGNSSAAEAFVTIAGTNSTLALTNTNAVFWVTMGTAASSVGSAQATLDLSGLGVFNASIAKLLVGAYGSFTNANRPCGILYLALTNNLALGFQTNNTESNNSSTNAGALDVGDANSNNGGNCFLFLGLVNNISADAVLTGRQKSSHCLIQFNPYLLAGGFVPSAVFGGFSGQRVLVWSIGDGVSNTGTTTCAGTNDFTGGNILALVNTMYVGRGSTGSNGVNNASSGLLKFDDGIINVNNLFVGYEQTNIPKSGIGTIDVNTNAVLGTNATLIINSNLSLAVTPTNGSATLNINGGTVLANNIVCGTNAGASTINFTTGTLVVTNKAIVANFNLSQGGILQLAAGTTASFTVLTNLTVDGSTYTVNITALPGITAYPTDLPLIHFASESGQFAGVLGTTPVSPFGGGAYEGYITNEASSIDFVITNGPPPQIAVTWEGETNGSWDLTTLNWLNAGTPTNFAQGDFVTFDDTLTGTTNVNITMPLLPASLTVNNTLSNYVFSGAGYLTGPTALMKTGSGTLTLTESGGDAFTGGLIVSNGLLILDDANTAIGGGSIITAGATVQVGNNDTNGSLPSGPVTLGGSLTFLQSSNATITNLLSGAGTFAEDDTNIVTLTGDNVGFTGTFVVNQGTLRIGAVNAVGRGTNTQITVAGGATLDVNAISGTNQVTVAGAGVGGNGAIVNNGPDQAPSLYALSYINLAGDTTIGGRQRWDLRAVAGASANPAQVALSTGGQPFNLSKVGTNLIGIISSRVDTNLANIDIQSGTLQVAGNITGLGNPTNTLTVENGADFQIYSATNLLNKILVLMDGATLESASGSNIIVGPLVLNTNAAGGPGNCALLVNGTALSLRNQAITGPGNLIKNGTSPLSLSGTNLYTGNTLINAGSLVLSGSAALTNSPVITIAPGANIDVTKRADLALALISGQTLFGSGSITGNLETGAGSSLAPGTGQGIVGTLSVSGTATLQGLSYMELDKTNAPASNDVLAANTILYGGSLVVTNIDPTHPPAAGDSFLLFNSPIYLGAFTNVALPPLGLGLAWTNTLASNGTIAVISFPIPQPSITSFSLSATNLIFAGTNGLPGAPFSVLASTNVALPFSNWIVLATNAFDTNGGFDVTNAIDPTISNEFFILAVP